MLELDDEAERIVSNIEWRYIQDHGCTFKAPKSEIYYAYLSGRSYEKNHYNADNIRLSYNKGYSDALLYERTSIINSIRNKIRKNKSTSKISISDFDEIISMIQKEV